MTGFPKADTALVIATRGSPYHKAVTGIVAAESVAGSSLHPAQPL